MHEGADAAPGLLLFVTKLGMTECFRHLATSRTALQKAELQGQGLLGTAALSGSAEMVELVGAPTHAAADPQRLPGGDDQGTACSPHFCPAACSSLRQSTSPHCLCRSDTQSDTPAAAKPLTLLLCAVRAQVISTLEMHRLPVNPCRRAPDARGYSALHWAADAPNLDLVYRLLLEVPCPVTALKGCAARGCGKTPSQLLAELGPAFAINEAILAGLVDPSHPGNQQAYDSHPQDSPATNPAAALWGSGVAAVLGRHPAATHLGLLLLYFAMLVQLGWQDPLTWWTVAVTCVSLHGVMPYIYCELYVKDLERVRGMAAEHGLAVSRSMRFLNASVQCKYEDFVARRASSWLVFSNAVTAVILAAPAAAGRLFEHWGLWYYIPALAGSVVLLPLLSYAVLTKRVRMWWWLELAINSYSAVLVNLPRMYAMAVGDMEHCVVPSSLLLNAGNPLIVGFVLVLSTFPMTAASAMVPQAPGCPLHVPTEALFTLFVCSGNSPAVWCIESMTGPGTALSNLGSALTVIYCLWWRLLTLGVRLRGENQSLRSFLASDDARNAASNKGAEEDR